MKSSERRQRNLPGLPVGRVRVLGFTLIELLVVIAVLLLVSTVVIPASVPWLSREEDELQRVIDHARRLAIERAGPLTLNFGSDGSWFTESSAPEGVLILSDGSIDWRPDTPVKLHISPLGMCMLAGAVGPPDPSFSLDPVRCRLLGSSLP